MPASAETLPRSLLPALLVVVLAGCATPGTREAGSSSSPNALDHLATSLPGHYVSVVAPDRATQTLRIERRGGSPSGDELALLLVQRDSGSEGGRRFGLRLGETGQPDRLRGEFAPLEDGERAQRRCAMDFRLGPEGLVGETDPQSCRFGDGEQSVGLLKEIAFDGRDLRIGDRLVHPASGEPRGEDRIVHFLPAVDYDGWAGRRDGDGWRVAREFTIRAGQDPERLVDAAGMELGFSAELRYYRIQRQDSPVLLRLTIRDADTGETLAEGWSEPGARTIGLALPDFQVGLRLAR